MGQEWGLGIGAVARRVGVAASTLRTWDRRYGIGPSRHSPGGHRRYGEHDVARLELMVRLVQEGVPPEEAARAALAADEAALAAGPPPRADRAERPGFVPLAGAATPAGRALMRSARALDARAMREQIETALRRDGVEHAWQELLAPALIAIGERHAASGALIEVEHLLSGCVQNALASEIALAEPPDTARPVLLACAAEEQHSLPVHALGAALAAERVAVRVLGARVPARALADAVRRLGPAVVFVWSQMPETGDPAALAELPGGRPAAHLLVGGPGWPADRLPPEARPVHSLPEALKEIRAAFGRG
ncbi:MerR family transcriptional regulator [Spirillospora sp. NPDC050679]